MKTSLSSKKIESIKRHISKEQKLFMKKVFSSDNRFSMILLKNHLIVENLLDKIIKNISTHPNWVLDRNFSQKNEILRYFGVLSPEIYEKIKNLNNVRNKFAHNLDYKLTLSDVALLVESKVTPRNKRTKLVEACAYVVGYLSFYDQFSKYYPFLFLIMENRKFFKKDKLFLYTEKSLKEGLKKLNLKEWEI